MKRYFSVFSGDVYCLDEKYTYHLDSGQLEITNEPKINCKHCFGKGFTSKTQQTGHYNMCKCLLSEADEAFLKNASEHQVEDVILHTKKDTFKTSDDII
jgi:hypothetical protein